MMKEIKHEFYESPQVEVIEMNSLQVMCTSPGQQNAGNQGYASNDYQW